MSNDEMSVGDWSFWSDLVDSFFTRIEIFEGDFTDYQDVEDISNTVMALLCVICAGLAAGLTMGLLSLDSTKLEIKQMTGTAAERDAAAVLLPIIKRHHLLLVTLLLFNSIANEALPIFLGALVPNYVAVFLSVTLVLIFGEILPSAFFTGPQQLITAAKMSRFVWGLMAFFSPIAVPIAKLLDLAFGSDDENKDGRISRADLEALFILQGRVDAEDSVQGGTSLEGSGRYQGLDNDDIGPPLPLFRVASNSSPQQRQPEEGLHQYEVSILTGILSLSRTLVGDCMIPLERMYALEATQQLTPGLLKTILSSGFSRIPIYRQVGAGSLSALPLSFPRVWLGYALVKTLIGPDSLPPTLASLSPGSQLREPLFVRPSLGLLEMLAMFRQGRCHLALITLNPMAALANVRDHMPCGGDSSEDTAILGLVTLEDVIERILQSDLVDETDVVDEDLMPRNSLTGTVLFHGFHKARDSRSGEGGAGGAGAGERDGSNRARRKQLLSRVSRELAPAPAPAPAPALVPFEQERSPQAQENSALLPHQSDNSASWLNPMRIFG